MDVNFPIDGKRFNYRVAAFIVCGDNVLLQKSDGYPFWNMIGGRAHICENSKDALAREIKEELGIEIIKDQMKLLQLSENFFVWEGIDVHEMLIVYRVEIDDKYLKEFDDFELIDGHKERSKWFKKSEVQNIMCLPATIYDLAKNDNDFVHTIKYD